MKDRMMQQRVQRALDAELSSLRTSDRRREEIFAYAMEGKKVKKKLSVGLVLAILLVLMSVSALAAALLSRREIVEQIAVPLAQGNDTQEMNDTYSHEELAALIKSLEENGFTLEENSSIMRSFRNGGGYYEEEVIMAICREAFGGYFYQWTVEEQYWFEEMMVQIGHIDRNGHCLPGAGDMTVEEARARAAGLLNAEYQAELPVASDDMWEIDDYFGREAGDEACERPPVWSFTYVDRVTGIDRYFITMTQSGDVMDMQAAGVTSYREASSISQVMDLMETQYGSLTEWPIELWAEFGEVIRDMRPATANEWAFQHAGYCLPKWTEDVPLGDARLKAIEAVGLPYTTWFTTTFCKDGERTIWRVVTHTKEPGHEMSAKYDAIWVVELDSRTGEVLRKEEYVYGKSLMRMMYVPFSVAERTPTFENGVNQTEYAQAQAEYGENWFFWPLTVQARVKGAPHSVPAPGEMTREQAVQKALDAVIAEKGQAAVDALGTYQVGVILARYLETDGLVRTYWEVYFTTDPVGLSDGWRVTFAGENAETEEVWITEASNWGNG